MESRLGTLLWSVVLLCVVMCGAATAQAAASANSDQPSREQVLKLMSVMEVQQSVDRSLHEAQIQVKDAARESFVKQNPQADDATLKKLDAVFDSTPFFKFEDIAEVVVPIYQKNLTAADVQAGIDFYSSPAGKRLLEKVPEILHEANEEGGKLVQKKMEAYGEELERKLEAFQSELRSQQAPPPAVDAAKAPPANTEQKTAPEEKSK